MGKRAHRRVWDSTRVGRAPATRSGFSAIFPSSGICTSRWPRVLDAERRHRGVSHGRGVFAPRARLGRGEGRRRRVNRRRGVEGRSDKGSLTNPARRGGKRTKATRRRPSRRRRRRRLGSPSRSVRARERAALVVSLAVSFRARRVPTAPPRTESENFAFSRFGARRSAASSRRQTPRQGRRHHQQRSLRAAMRGVPPRRADGGRVDADVRVVRADAGSQLSGFASSRRQVPPERTRRFLHARAPRRQLQGGSGRARVPRGRVARARSVARGALRPRTVGVADRGVRADRVKNFRLARFTDERSAAPRVAFRAKLAGGRTRQRIRPRDGGNGWWWRTSTPRIIKSRTRC